MIDKRFDLKYLDILYGKDIPEEYLIAAERAYQMYLAFKRVGFDEETALRLILNMIATAGQK